MEQKILKRLEEISDNLADLAQKRESLVREIRSLDSEIEMTSRLIIELKTLLENDSKS